MKHAAVKFGFSIGTLTWPHFSHVDRFLALATVSYVMGDARAATTISAMVLLAIVTAFVQEHRSSRAAAELVWFVRRWGM
jgi:magnesium-transporting ATPase (P-type)